MLTIKDAALAVARHPNTIRRWISEEGLGARQDRMSRVWYIAEAELVRFCKANDVHVASPFLERVAE